MGQEQRRSTEQERRGEERRGEEGSRQDWSSLGSGLLPAQAMKLHRCASAVRASAVRVRVRHLRPHEHGTSTEDSPEHSTCCAGYEYWYSTGDLHGSTSPASTRPHPTLASPVLCGTAGVWPVGPPLCRQNLQTHSSLAALRLCPFLAILHFTAPLHCLPYPIATARDDKTRLNITADSMHHHS